MLPSMFNQYKHKKKRAVNPDAPPRPTLLGHDAQMKNMQATDHKLEAQLQSQHSEIASLQSKVRNLEVTVNQLLAALRSRM